MWNSGIESAALSCDFCDETSSSHFKRCAEASRQCVYVCVCAGEWAFLEGLDRCEEEREWAFLEGLDRWEKGGGKRVEPKGETFFQIT